MWALPYSGKSWGRGSDHGIGSSIRPEMLHGSDLSRNPHLTFPGSSFPFPSTLRKGQNKKVGILWICMVFCRPKPSRWYRKMVEYFAYWCYPYKSPLYNLCCFKDSIKGRGGLVQCFCSLKSQCQVTEDWMNGLLVLSTPTLKTANIHLSVLFWLKIKYCSTNI